MSRNEGVIIVGAGLAGSEAAWQCLKRGVPVTLYEMKKQKKSPAHHTEAFAELVCSNSLRSDRLENAVGLLKEEMRRLDSLVMLAADKTRVPAGGALAVDRVGFSEYITEIIRQHPLCRVVDEEMTEIPDTDTPVIIATGPLTSDGMCESIKKLPGMTTLSFYDAAAPIVYKESLDMTKCFRQSRYGRGDDYLNCPLNEEEYNAFITALLAAETAPIHGFEETGVFDGCMPIESMARRGRMVPAFGPMKPVGLIDPRSGKPPFAALQLRQDDAGDSLYNLVGFQTRLKFPEQKRVFGMIPGLEQAEYARYGVMHRNTFLNSPGMLDEYYRLKTRENVFFAGQMTGVEGYVESASSGLMCGLNAARICLGQELILFPDTTAHGALSHYVSRFNRNFQPMNITFGLMPPPGGKFRGKQEKYALVAQRALDAIDGINMQLAESEE